MTPRNGGRDGERMATETPQDRLARLLEPIHERALRFCRRLCATRQDAEDLYHDAIVAAWRGLSGLSDSERFGSWFFRIIINTFRNRQRRLRWRGWLPWNGDEDHAQEAATPSLTVDPRGQLAARRVLELAFRALSAEERSLVILFELEQYSIAEIAQIWSCPEGTIKSRLSRARDKMRQRILSTGAAGKHAPQEVNYELQPHPTATD